MDNSNPFTLMNNPLPEITQETHANHTQPVLDLPLLKSILADADSLPREALFLGIAEDSLPVLLNLYDPIPGPILITGDRASGKTSLLQMIARGTEYTHTPSEVQFGVITPHPDEWVQLQKCKTNAGIYTTNDEATFELLQSLVTWAHNNKGDQQSILLLIDSFEEMVKIKDKAEQNLRWLLLRGPSRRVWPIISLNAGHIKNLHEWMDFFHTRLFGCIQNPDDAQSASGGASTSFEHLTPGAQFILREGEDWLSFWSPAID